MAYQLWKFGLLGQRLPLPRLRRRHGEGPLWSTTSRIGGESPTRPAFGRASWVCNVIDTRQSYLQKLLKQALAALGYEAQAGHSVHYSYEMVALSHATARELGYNIDAESDRPFVEVSGRKGLGVKADDLHRSAHREGRERSGEAESGASRPTRCAGSRRRLPSPRCGTSW